MRPKSRRSCGTHHRDASRVAAGGHRQTPTRRITARSSVILIVEDDALAAVIQDVLLDEGYAALAAEHRIA